MKKWVLIILLLIFVTPSILAYLFYLHPEWLSAPATNRGELIRPAIFVPKMFKSNDKWHIILWNPSKCLHECEINLDGLMRVQLALGRRLYNVDLCLLQNSVNAELSSKLTQLLKQNNICNLQASTKSMKLLNLSNNKAEIFIVNPEKYWVLRYKSTVPLDDIYHDIKHLLVHDE
jgi:hypothetical protein